MQGGNFVSSPIDANQPVECASRAILAGFEHYHSEFKRITLQARGHFEGQDWQAVQRDALERLELYSQIVGSVVRELNKEILGENKRDRNIWGAMRVMFSEMISNRSDPEIAETFYNSMSRQMFVTVGVDPKVEFVDKDFDYISKRISQLIYTAFPVTAGFEETLVSVLASYGFHFEDIHRDATLGAAHIEAIIEIGSAAWESVRLEFLNSVFYRSKGAYLVGRLCQLDCTIPLVLALRNASGRIYLDAVLLSEDEVSILFSYTRSYFHVEADVPSEVVKFLQTILPQKRIAELFISIGYNKHGKTELYRDLLRHLRNTQDQFVIAPGERGMVMLVFTMPSYDMVFKVIKDHFGEPKSSTRKDVMDHYQLVFRHDRAGRLVDAQEFEHLEFDISRFSPELLDELLATAGQTVYVDNGKVVIRHLYTERRLTPLDIFVRTYQSEQVTEAVLDYGQAIRDLAATNIFPGDILLKNFGVTRHQRVVFYDYDELSLLTDCRFRAIPQPRSDSDEYESEPWFYVGKNDIFPEEFRTFLGLPQPYRDLFIEAHGDLFGPAFWKSVQRRHEKGEVIDIIPYKASKRLNGHRQ